MTREPFLSSIKQLIHDAIEMLTLYNAEEDELKEMRSQRTAEIVFSMGGKTLHRGYFCPNKAKDIVCGNISRGHICKAKNRKTDFKFYFDAQGNLLGYDKRTSYGTAVNYIVTHNNIEWEFNYQFDKIAMLYATKYCDGRVVMDVFLPCIEGKLFEDGIYEAWMFDWQENSVHAEHISGVLSACGVLGRSEAGDAFILAHDEYFLSLNEKGDMVLSKQRNGGPHK